MLWPGTHTFRVFKITTQKCTKVFKRGSFGSCTEGSDVLHTVHCELWTLLYITRIGGNHTVTPFFRMIVEYTNMKSWTQIKFEVFNYFFWTLIIISLAQNRLVWILLSTFSSAKIISNDILSLYNHLNNEISSVQTIKFEAQANFVCSKPLQAFVRSFYFKSLEKTYTTR